MQPAEGADDGGLAGAVGAEEAEELAAVEMEADVVYGGERAELDGEVFGVDALRCGLAEVRPLIGGLTVADMPDFRMLLGLSTWTLTPKTWCWRSSGVWTLRGRNSASESISWMWPVKCGPLQGVDGDAGGLADVDAAEVGFGDVDLDPELRGFEHGEDDLVGGDEVAGADADGFDEWRRRGR